MSAFSAIGVTALALFTGFLAPVVPADEEWFNVSGSVASRKGPITQASVCFDASCEDAAARRDVDLDASLEYGIKRGQEIHLTKVTNRDVRVTWKSLTRRTCKVRQATLTGTQIGRCKISAQSKPVMGLTPYEKTFRIRVIKG